MRDKTVKALDAVNAIKLYDAGTEGDRFVRLILGPGGLFGDHPFGATAFGGFTTPEHEQAFAHGPTEVIELDRSELEAATKAQTEFATFLLESATTLAQFLKRRLRRQFVTPVRTRVAIALRDLICFEGQRCRYGRAIDVRLTHQDLAELVGAARPWSAPYWLNYATWRVVSYTKLYF